MSEGQKLPEIIISKEEDSINGGNLVYKLTLEEFNDLMHHTHKLEDLYDENGILFPPSSPLPPSEGGGDAEPTPPEGNKPISAIQQLQDSIENLKSRIHELEDTVQLLSNTVEDNNAELNSKLDTYIDEDLMVGDWDATTPEIDKMP